MQAKRVIATCVLLAAVSFGQSSSSSTTSPSSGSDQNASADQGQSGQPAQPVSPLEEPKKPSESDQAKPQASTFDLGGSANTGQDQQVGEIRLMDRYTQLNGDPTRSFRESGSNNLAEFNYFVDRRFVITRRIQVLSMFRSTDDKSIDPEHNSLQKAYIRMFGPRDEYIVGDALVNYSTLSFNQNIKGLSLSHLVGDHWKFSGVSGIFIDRYGSLWNDIQGRPYVSIINGLRGEYGFNRENRVGLNFSSSADQTNTLPPQTNGVSPLPAINKVASIDGKFGFKNGLRLNAEYAYSFTDFDRRFAGTCVAPCDTRQPQPALDGSQGDYGIRLEESWRYKRLSLRSSYLRYQPNFASVNARQIADLQDFVFRAGYDLTNWLTLDGTVRRSNNDLKQQLPFETKLWGPEMRFIFHDLPFYKRGTFEVGYRHRDVTSSDDSINRFVRMPYAEFTFPIKQAFFTIGYERRQAQDNSPVVDPVTGLIDNTQRSSDAILATSNTDRVYFGIRGIMDLGHWEINPTLRYEIERQSHRPFLTQAPIPDPTLMWDSNRLGMAGLYIQAPKWFILEGQFRDSSATIVGPSGFSRPSYSAAVSYKIRNDENTVFTFGFERNNNFYFTSPNYDERVWSGTLLYRFGKHAGQ
jgi:hypothetical protein